MALPQVAILSNPKCAHNKKYMSLIRAVVAKSNNIFHFELDEDATIPEALTQFSKTKPKLLIINGGDTTIHTSINFIMNEKLFDEMPVLAVLATGRANKLAFDLGLNRSPSKVLERLIHLAQVEGMDEHIIQKPMIKITTGDERAPFYGVYFKAGSMLRQMMHYRDLIKFLPLPKKVKTFFAYCMVVVRAIGLPNKKDPKRIGYVPESRIKLKAAGDIKGRYLGIITTTLNSFPSGRRPFGRFGKGNMGFAGVTYGFLPALRALKALLFNKIGAVSIAGIETRRSDEIIMTGATTVSLDDEIIILNPEHEVTLSTDECIDFISLKDEKAKSKG